MSTPILLNIFIQISINHIHDNNPLNSAICEHSCMYTNGTTMLVPSPSKTEATAISNSDSAIALLIINGFYQQCFRKLTVITQLYT